MGGMMMGSDGWDEEDEGGWQDPMAAMMESMAGMEGMEGMEGMGTDEDGPIPGGDDEL